MYHTGMWRQRAGSAKISLCQLVDRWEREDGGQIRVLISFHQLWIPAELKVNIWGFSKPSRCLESMDWLVLAAPLSGFVGRPGPISNVSQLHLSQRLPGQNHYTLYCIPLSRSSFILFFSLSICLHMSHGGLCHALWHMVWVICGENVCWETSGGGLLFMITWKTIVRWYWIEDLQSLFRNKCGQKLGDGENFFLFLIVN